MKIGNGNYVYKWHEDWAVIPDTPSGRNNGRTHGIGVLQDNRVVVFAQAVPGVLIYDQDGQIVDSWGDRFVGAHGLSVVSNNGCESLWLADQASCEVCKVDLEGNLLIRLDSPPIADRHEGKYMPTWADEHPQTGEIWVADGYGGSALYRYSADGSYRGRWLGDEAGAAGRFDSPHGLAFHPSGDLYLTDRANHRICIYDAEGKLLRHSDAACHSPCSFGFFDDKVVVTELFGGIKILDQQLNLVANLGEHPHLAPPTGWQSKDKWTWPSWAEQADWPNVERSEYITPGTFNSPHGIAAAANGDLYVAEWIIGGRITKLEKI